MKQVFLIALREYKQYVLSRGFLLFVLMFPLGFVLGGAAVGFAERAKPDRHFVVFDQTGEYAAAIDREIELRRLRQNLASWDAYVTLGAKPDVIENGEILAPFAPATVTLDRIEAFNNAGGVEAAQTAVAPFLRDGMPAFTPSKRTLIRVEAPPELATAKDLASAADILRPYLLEEKMLAGPDGAAVSLFAAILIPEGYNAQSINKGEAAEAEFWSRNLTDDSLRSAISRALNTTLRRQKVAELGLEEQVLDDIADTEAAIASFRPDRAEDEAELGIRDTVEIILPAALTYMLVFIIMGIGNLLLTNTIEERSNKIIEILLSSVTAEQLMLGKLIGIGAVGLTLPAVFLIGGGTAGLAFPGSAEIMGGIVDTLFSTPLFLTYLFYFFCAYAIFSMIFLAIGSISNSLQDAQSYMGPITLLLFAPLPFVVVMYQNPNGMIASILTWIPIYTPYAVLLRAASDPPLWEIIGATALMLVFAFFLARMMGRIFRRAILQSSPQKAKDVIKLAAGRGD